MKIKKQRNIAIVYDAVSISKDIEVVGGALNQNYYAESATYIPNRYVTPLVLKPIIYVADPNGVIEDGNKNEELLTCEWFENGTKIVSGDDYKIEKDYSLTVFKNSQTDISLSYSATWLDPRKKLVITIEDSITLTTTLLSEEAMSPRLILDKPLNWIHNPLKGERVYTIRAYVSTDKVYESAVEWYYVDENKKDTLIDENCPFYVSGQYTNALDVDSNYMENVIIKAKNIDNEKLKEIYWFFDKEGNPITYSEPEKTIIEGKDVFNLPESPITSKLDYRINGLTLNNLIENGDFSQGTKRWQGYVSKLEIVDGWLKSSPKTESIIFIEQTNVVYDKDNDIVYHKCLLRTDSNEKIRVRINGITPGASIEIDKNSGNMLLSGVGKKEGNNFLISSNVYELENKDVSIFMKEPVFINLTQTFGAGNEPSKEWCDEHIQGYFEGVKSVQTPMRIKSNNSSLYINNNLSVKSVGEVSDYIENGKLYRNISNDGEILEETEVVNLSTNGNLITYPNGTIFIEPATLVEQQYNDGLQVDLPIKTLESIKVGTEYLDTSKAVVKDNLITHPDIANGDNVTIEYIYDENPIRNTNSIAYLVLEDILDEFWLDNVYTYKITDGEWELVKVTDIEDYEEWLKTEKTSPHTLAPDGVVFGEYKADTKFLRQFPSSLYVDFYVPSRLKEEITQVKAKAIVGTKDGVVLNPDKYFDITWFKKENKPGAIEVEIGKGGEITIDITNKDAISLLVEDKGAYKSK